MNQQFHFKPKGFTLIEVLISIIIMSIITLAVGNMFVGSLKSQQQNSALLTNIQKDKIVLNQLVAAIQYADISDSSKITAPTGSYPCPIFEYRDSKNIYHAIALGSYLIKEYTDTTGVWVPLSNVKVTNLEFSLLGGNVQNLIINIKVTAVDPKTTKSFDVQSQVRLINARNPSPSPSP